MDIEQIKQLKRQLEQDVLQTINKFEITTGVLVENIRSENDYRELGAARKTHKVNILVIIP